MLCDIFTEIQHISITEIKMSDKNNNNKNNRFIMYYIYYILYIIIYRYCEFIPYPFL